MVKKATEATPNQLLRAARKERNWTQKEVADAIGSPQSFNVSRWEQGTAFPSAHYIQQLCLLFGKSSKELGLLVEEHIASSELPTEADSPPLWNVPYRRNPFFTGREEVLTQLRDRLTANGTAALTQTQAISGLGGIGKTQIAIEYAYCNREVYRLVAWVRAASRDALISDFVSLAGLLRLPEANEQDQNIVVTAVKRWLASHQGWLLILDNADDLELASEFLPTGGNGHILLTTRAQATGSIAPSIAVEKMEQNEGAQLLLCRAKILAPDASLLYKTARYLHDRAQYIQAEPLYQRALRIWEQALGPAHPDLAKSLNSLAILYQDQSKYGEAEPLYQRALRIREQALGPAHPDLAKPLNNLANLYYLQGKYGEAEPLHQRALHIWEQALGPDHPLPAYSLNNLASLYYLQGRYADAEQLHQRALRIREQTLGPEHPDVANSLNGLADLYSEQGKYGEAEPLYQRALRIREQALGPEHPDVAETLHDLAYFRHSQGSHVEAAFLYQRALAIRERVLGHEHPDTITTLKDYSDLLQKTEQRSEVVKIEE